MAFSGIEWGWGLRYRWNDNGGAESPARPERAVAYVIGFFVMLAVLGWHPDAPR